MLPILISLCIKIQCIGTVVALYNMYKIYNYLHTCIYIYVQLYIKVTYHLLYNHNVHICFPLFFLLFFSKLRRISQTLLCMRMLYDKITHNHKWYEYICLKQKFLKSIYVIYKYVMHYIILVYKYMYVKRQQLTSDNRTTPLTKIKKNIF